MKNIKKILALTTSVLLLAGVLAGCGTKATSDTQDKKNQSSQAEAKGTLDEIKKRGTIKIGVFSDKPPFGYVDEKGKNQGFDVYIGKRLAKDLLGDESKVEFVLVEAASRVEFLQANKVDIILANFTVTDERKQKVDFANPYMHVALGVVSPAGKPITSVDELKEIHQTANVINGKEEADLLLKNVKIVDVYSEAVNLGSLLIKSGKIVAINPPDSVKAKRIFDGQAMYAIPGLIDGHFHFESQLVTPTALSEAMVPHGTTSVFGECCDLISAGGSNGLEVAKAIFQDYEKLPYRIYPFAPGKKVKFEIVKEMLNWDFVIGLGEMNSINFVNGNEEDYKKVAYTKSINKMIDGHADAPTLYQENIFPAVGVMNDHDIWSVDSLKNNLKLGLPSSIMYGMYRVEPLVSGILKDHIPTDNMMFSTDNLAVENMMKVGDMDACVQQAIDLGLEPITAIKMCTYNTAKHFKMEDKIGSLTPGRYADIVLIKDLKQIKPVYVFKGGEVVAQDGKLLKNANINYSKLVTKSVPGLNDFMDKDLEIKPLEVSKDGKQAKVKVFNYYGFGPEGFSKDVWLPISNGKIVPELNGEKLLNFSIIQCYAKDKKREVVNGYIRQFPMDKGAVAIGFSAPTPNIMVMGTNAVDMYSAIKQVDKYPGGYVLAEAGKINETLPMNIYGMMTDYSAQELVKKSESFTQALEKLGHKHNDPIVNSLLELFYLADRYGFLK
jgi:adenine deaminase